MQHNTILNKVVPVIDYRRVQRSASNIDTSNVNVKSA